jgi:hypothetical protein
LHSNEQSVLSTRTRRQLLNALLRPGTEKPSAYLPQQQVQYMFHSLLIERNERNERFSNERLFLKPNTKEINNKISTMKGGIKHQYLRAR